MLSPGFIDVQINGAYGRDFCDPRLTPADVQEVCARLLASGCTALCPTLVSSAPATYAACLATLRATREQLAVQNQEAIAAGAAADGAASQPSPRRSTALLEPRLSAAEAAPPGAPRLPPGARLLGAHLEGPFLAPEKKGAHEPAHLRAPAQGGASLGAAPTPSP